MNTFGSMISDADAKKLNMAINSEKNKAKEPQKKLEKKIVKQIVAKKPELAIAQPEKSGIVYERNKEGKLEKKVHGAGRELSRQITLAKSVEDNLSSGLETNKKFTKKAKIIDNKRVLVFERTKQVIDDINNDKPDRGVVDMAALQEAMKELEADLTDPYVKLVYSKLADMNKFILLDQLHDEGATPDENKIISFDTISPSQFNVIYYSDSGYLMQIINPDEVNRLITDDRARYNIIAPNGSVVAENIDFQQAQTQFEDLSGAYQKDLKKEFNRQGVPEKTQELEAKVDDMMAEMEADEKSAQEQLSKYNAEKEALGITTANLEYQEKPLAPVINEKLNKQQTPEKTQELEAKVDDMMAEMEADEKSGQEQVSQYNLEKEALGVTAPNLEYQEKPLEPVINKDELLETLYQEPKKNDDELLDTLYTEPGSVKVESAGLDAEQIKLLKKINVLNLSEDEKREMLNDIAKHGPVAIEGQQNILESASSLDENSSDNSINQETETLPNVENKEYESSPLFNKFVLSKISGWSKEQLGASLADENFDRQNVKAWDRNYIVGIVSFSNVGYSTYLTNIEDVKSENGIDTKSEKAIYNLVGPDGVATHTNLSYQEAENLLWSESKKYLIILNKEFEENKEAIEKELGSSENSENNEQKNISNVEGQNETVLEYAENMGIKAEQLAAHPEFLELNSAQQLFVLEALNRASLNKIKVEANSNFLSEKQNKKWYQLGFGLNQKFHKKKHEVLVAKDIHSKGLEGYGEAEFTWLIDVIKKGPEIIVDEDGEVDSVNYLQVEVDADPVRQKLIDKYNYEAYHLSNTPVGSENYQTYSNDVKVAREALLASAKDEWEAAELVTKLIEAEKQLKLHHFIKSDSNNEKIIQGLVDKNLGSWQKFGMMMAGQKDKAAYMGIGAVARLGLRSELATAIIGKSFTYAVGPLVAAAIGGWRANSQARAGLVEQNELAKLGVASQDKKIKTLNLAVGSENKEGQIIKIGLADKLESLTDQYNSLSNEIAKLKEINRTSKQEEELENMSTEQSKLWDRLKDRIEYTSQKMESDSVSYGEPTERAINYYRLLNTVEEAKAVVFNEEYILNYQNRYKKTYTSDRVTELTRSNKKITNISDNEEFKKINAKLEAAKLSTDESSEENVKKLEAEKQLMVRTWYKLDQLSTLSVSDRLASFLNFKEDQRESAEFKYLVRQTAGGAVMGATFAAVGAWIFEQTGLDHVISNKINQLGRLTHADQAFNWISGLFAGDQAGGGKAVEKIAEVVSTNEAVASSQEAASDYSPSESAEPAAVIESTESAATPDSESVQAAESIESAESAESAATPESQETEQLVATTPETSEPSAAAEAQTAAQAAAESTSKTYSREISNKPGQSNSVWRSLREIFKSNSQALGYQGDVNDTDALNRWAENQTANAINNSGDVTDKVFEGNKVSLLQENGQFKVAIEAGNGPEPGFLDNDVEVDAGETENLETSDTTNENVATVSDETGTTSKPETTTINSETIILKAPITPEAPETAVDNSKAINELAKIFHLAPEDIKTVGNEVVYEGKSGKIIFDTVKNTIKEVFDTNNKVIPQEFVDELRGRASMDKFVNRGGLDKIFSVWSKLGANDKIVYESLHLFNLSPTNELKLTPEALINKISGLFNVVAKDVAIDVDAKQFVLGNREFKMDLDGVNKLVKVLSRRFGA